MPQLQVVDTTERAPEPTGVQEFFSKLGKSYKDQSDRMEIGNLLKEYKNNRSDANAWENLQLGLEQSTISPTRRLQTQQNLNDMKKIIIERDKVLNSKVRSNILSAEERDSQKNNLIKTGMPDWEAEVYLDAPPGVKSRIQAAHQEQVARGFRSALPSEPEIAPQQEIPVEPEIASETKPSEGSIKARENVAQSYSSDAPEIVNPVVANEVASSPIVKKEWPDIPPPAETTASEREKIRSSNQKDNIKALQENHKKVRAIRDDQLALKRMQQLNDTGKLPSGATKWVAVNPETGDISTLAKRSGKVNPETQAYVKEVNKFIRNAKDYYGARVTNFDLSTFLAQLPTLTNTEQGRRLILKQMQQESVLQGIYANKVDEAIKHYGRNANLIDISKVVDDKIKEEESQLIKKMDLTLEASKLLDKMAANPKQYKNSVLVEKDGNFLAIPKEDLSNAELDGWSEY